MRDMGYVLDVRQRCSDIPSVDIDKICANIKKENSNITAKITEAEVTEIYINILTEINELFEIFSKNETTDFSKTMSFIAGLYKQILEKSKGFKEYKEIENKIKKNILKIRAAIIKNKKGDPLHNIYREEYTSQTKEKENAERTERDVLDVLDGLLESFGNISLTAELKTENSKPSPKSSNLTNKVKQARLEDIRGKITALRRNITELRRKITLINKELNSLIKEKEELEKGEEGEDGISPGRKVKRRRGEDGMSMGGSKHKSKSKSKKNKEKSLIEKVKTLFKF